MNHIWKEHLLPCSVLKKVVCEKCGVSATLGVQVDLNKFTLCIFHSGYYWVTSDSEESVGKRYSCEEVMIGKMLDE